MNDILNEMKSVSVKECEKDLLVDISQIVIDENKPKQERMLDFIYQVKNPYLFKVGDVAIHLVFNDSNHSFQQRVEEMITANIGN